MSAELNLRFPNDHQVIVRFGPDDDGSGELAFVNPIIDKDLRDIQWYIETYGAHSLGDPDDQETRRIAGLLPVWGNRLFGAVFQEDTAKSKFFDFWRNENDTRLLTVSSGQPDILALPWELLYYGKPGDGGGYLFMANPRISIRRRIPDAQGILKPFTVKPKDTLHLLFVVSRPSEAGFLDPRADSQPVLDAIDQYAPGRVTWEFLRPPTLDALIQRLEDKSRPPVDILHFDGHGVFDREGNLPNRAAADTKFTRLEDIVREKKAEVPVDPDCPPNTGYLLFEKPDGKPDFVSADKLGSNLHRHKVALVILSACQSAAVGKEKEKEDNQPCRPMGSVAARLTATGIPSVLAMTHSVLVYTTQALFGEFYKELAQNKGVGEALDNARRHLVNHPEKYNVPRGTTLVPLKLYDWFLPALYQQGADGPLLSQPSQAVGQKSKPPTNLPKRPAAGFFGRKRDLWHIERWFADPVHPTRRITITGFGGQGKTALALEAGRWLVRAGLFQAAVFVDYSKVQSLDAVSVAVSTIGSVLNESLIDAEAAAAALAKTPTLVILDNLEALAPESLRALLDAAVAWSEAGGSRVLCTTRRPDFNHAGYRVEGTFDHRRIQLDGLGSREAPQDALEWCAALMKLPPAPSAPAPKREAIIELFDRAKFHPLSIRVLAQQLKTRRPAELGERLEQLLSQDSGALSEDTPASLLASLTLSLDRLDDAARQVLPRLGVFQGGAFEDDLIAITGLGDPHAQKRKQVQGFLAAVEAGKAKDIFEAMGQPMPDEATLRELVTALRNKLAELPPPAPNLWPDLRHQLEAAALIEAENVSGITVPFVRFHPTLAPMLWAQLDAAQRQQLSDAHRQRYYALSGHLYREDDRHPHQVRAIAWRELPNLLYAAHAALDAGEADAVDFADKVNRFISTIFGLKQEADCLSAKAQAAGKLGSQAWFLAQSNRGEQLLETGHVAEATQVLQIILKQLGESPTYERAVTLGRLGRCFFAGGRPDLAAKYADEAIGVCDKLEPSNGVKRHRGAMLTDNADALAEQGKYTEARKAYENGLKVAEELNDLRSQGATLGQLGTLAIREGNLEQAAERWNAALVLFQQLREPAMEAVAWHQLGVIFHEARQWDEAERHYREAARIREERGNLAGAARTWNNLAVVSENAGKLDAAEMWYRKAIEGGRKTGDLSSTARALANLADLLQTQPGRLAEARQLAEESLTIKQTIDPNAAEIWKTYNHLAKITDQEAEAVTDARHKTELLAQARDHRRLAREAKRNFPGTRHELRRHVPLILGTLMAVQKLDHRQALEQALPGMEQDGWTSLVAVLRQILAGERDTDALCANLDFEDSMIVDTILQGLADPSTLTDLLPPEQQGNNQPGGMGQAGTA